MLAGMIVGAVFGVIYYFRRRGGLLVVSDAQIGLHAVLFQAALHAVTPGAFGALIGWLVF